jgi:hypothetical protein
MVEVELPDEAYVVRYGEMMRETDLAYAALRHSLQYGGEYALSVNTIPGATPDEIAGAGRRPNKRFCYTTVGELRKAGFAVNPNCGPDGHTNIVLPSPPSSDDLNRLVACFTGTGDNPNPVRPEER